MQSTGTKEQQKVDCLVEVKRIIEHTSCLLEDILTTVQGGLNKNARNLKKIPTKIKLLIESLNKVGDLVGTALRCDGKFSLPNDLLSRTKSKKNEQRAIY